MERRGAGKSQGCEKGEDGSSAQGHPDQPSPAESPDSLHPIEGGVVRRSTGHGRLYSGEAGAEDEKDGLGTEEDPQVADRQVRPQVANVEQVDH